MRSVGFVGGTFLDGASRPRPAARRGQAGADRAPIATWPRRRGPAASASRVRLVHEAQAIGAGGGGVEGGREAHERDELAGQGAQQVLGQDDPVAYIRDSDRLAGGELVAQGLER